MKFNYLTLALVALATAAVMAGCGKSEPSAAARESAWIYENQEKVKGKLKDPNSAEFRDVFVSKKAGAPFVCGEVNAKNSFGGFTGFQKFIAGGEVVVVASQMQAGDMDEVWGKTCVR